MEVFPSITRLLDRFNYCPQDIRQIHLATGPGSFTGLRIAVTMAKAMSLAAGVQIATVDTLDTIAANVADMSPTPTTENPGLGGMPIDRLAVVLDAKRGQFFTAIFERVDGDLSGAVDCISEDPGYHIPSPRYGLWKKVVPDCLMSSEQFLQRFAATDRPICLIGDGLLYCRGSFEAEGVRILNERLWSPTAAKVHALAYQKARASRFVDPLALVPFYLRGPEVTLKRT
jgi:tRNA threonylcarbamoyl adenosine modification protein YeaZ